MQTFLPYPDVEESVQILDDVRLRNQRKENCQIFDALYLNKGWIHHPAVKMWDGYEQFLFMYHMECCYECDSRGFDSATFMEWAVDTTQLTAVWTPEVPFFIGVDKFHASHRSNLKRKDAWHYRHFTEPTSLPYWWPTQNGY